MKSIQYPSSSSPARLFSAVIHNRFVSEIDHLYQLPIQVDPPDLLRLEGVTHYRFIEQLKKAHENCR